MIFPEAFSQLKHLEVLNLDKAKFRYPERDLAFLKPLEKTLARLSLNNAFPKENFENLDILSFVKMEELDDVHLQQVGLLQIKKIDQIFPNLAVLDLGRNRIFAIEAIEILYKLENLAEVSFKDNPICVHKHLTEMVQDVVPTIEVVNHETLKEAGFKAKQELGKLREQISSMGKNQVGSAAGDRHLEEAGIDPLRRSMYGEIDSTQDGEDQEDRAKQSAVDRLVRQAEKESDKSTQMFNELEKNFGLRLQALCEPTGKDADGPADP